MSCVDAAIIKALVEHIGMDSNDVIIGEGGVKLSAGDGISLANDTVSVKYDADTMEIKDGMLAAKQKYSDVKRAMGANRTIDHEWAQTMSSVILFKLQPELDYYGTYWRLTVDGTVYSFMCYEYIPEGRMNFVLTGSSALNTAQSKIGLTATPVNLPDYPGYWGIQGVSGVTISIPNNDSNGGISKAMTEEGELDPLYIHLYHITQTISNLAQRFVALYTKVNSSS